MDLGIISAQLILNMYQECRESVSLTIRYAGNEILVRKFIRPQTAYLTSYPPVSKFIVEILLQERGKK